MLVLVRHSYCGSSPLAIAGLGFAAAWRRPRISAPPSSALCVRRCAWLCAFALALTGALGLPDVRLCDVAAFVDLYALPLAWLESVSPATGPTGFTVRAGRRLGSGSDASDQRGRLHPGRHRLLGGLGGKRRLLRRSLQIRIDDDLPVVAQVHRFQLVELLLPLLHVRDVNLVAFQIVRQIPGGPALRRRDCWPSLSRRRDRRDRFR